MKRSDRKLGSSRGQTRRAISLMIAWVCMHSLFTSTRKLSTPLSWFTNFMSVERSGMSEENPYFLQVHELANIQLPHGHFYFGPHSHSVRTLKNEFIQPSWTPDQERLLNDDEIDVDRERARCASYNFDLQTENGEPIKRRRLFLGSLIASDSMEVLRAVGTETYNMFHSVAFIESNTTQNFTPRKWRFLDEDERPSQHLHEIYQLFGPKTKVSVDYYVTSRKNREGGNGHHGLLQEVLPKEGIIHRWRMNGMTPDDVAVVTDTDETFTRDFLRALQICDIPSFRDRTCLKPKLIGSTMVFESSSECLTSNRRWYHPDAILGACVEQIGDSTVHPAAIREWTKENSDANPINMQSMHGGREKGYGQKGNYSLTNYSITGHYPLWSTGDIRSQVFGHRIAKADESKSHTAYHFHNFFDSADDIHFKYYTYGHASGQAMKKPIWELQDDLELGVRCAKGLKSNHPMGFGIMSFHNLTGTSQPIYYLNEEVRRARHLAWQAIIKEDEDRFNMTCCLDS